ncbi:MAG TPA: hypothetical protein VK939_16585 [Longimicrobiales bacterium]|nr:hypothetical protein [Longimicrobiales bacterium]
MTKARAKARQPQSGARPDRAAVAERELPRWAPIAAYALATVALFPEFFFSGTSLLGMDSMALSYFARNFYTEVVQGVQRFPLWQPYLFGGLPFIDGMHGDIFYPPSLALFFLDARTMWGWKMVLHIFAAGCFTYLWLRRGLGTSRLAALFGGLVYMMGADLVSLVFPGGDGKLFVSALAPLVFWLAERAVRGQRLADFAAFGLGITVIVLTSHMQLAYFCVWGVSLYFGFRLWQLWREARSGRTVARLAGLFALAGGLGVGAAAIQFLPPLDYLREWSQRTTKENRYEYATSYSLHPEEAMSLLVPEFIGDNAQTETRSGTTYWGRNPLKYNHEYLGLVPLLLVPVLLRRRREPRTWFFVGLAGISLLYALGATTPLFRLFYLVPGVKLFRAPSLIIFLTGLSVATLAALALDRLAEWRRSAEAALAARWFQIAAVTFLLLALLAQSGMLMGAWTSLIYPRIVPEAQAALQENMPHILRGFWIAAGLSLALLGWWELTRRGVWGMRGAVVALALLAALDLYRVDRPFVRATALMNRSAERATPLFTPDASIQYLQRARDAGSIFRVLDLAPFMGQGSTYGPLMSNVLAVHGLEQAAGHHGNELAAYRQLVNDDVASNVLQTDLRLADLLNVEYMVAPAPVQIPGYEEVFRGGAAVIYRNPDALPRAFLVGETETLEGAAALARIFSDGFEPRRTAVVSAALPADVAPQPGVEGGVVWEERSAERALLRVSADRPALLVLTDNYYPSWKARIDGRLVPVYRTNHAFRGVAVPAGTHQVEFFYDARPLRAAALTSIALLLLLLGVTLAGARAGRGAADAA